jgi:paraquat-inducible protein A
VVKLAQLTDAAPALGAAFFLGFVVSLALALRNLELDRLQPGATDLEGDLAQARPPDPASLERTLALSLAALILFVPANLLPTLTIAVLGSTQADTVFDGVLSLWQAGMWPLALIVLCASIVIPFAKIGVLLFLVLTIRMAARRRERTWLFRAVEGVGRWSMLDVYVISLIVAVINLGTYSSAGADSGALAFASVVVITIVAARQFDPRLIWHDDADP